MTGEVGNPSLTLKRRLLRLVASLFRHFKWLGYLLNFVVRLMQPRYPIGTVGVLLDETRTKVLLVEHVFRTDLPWGLPGGWLNRGEDPAEALEREFGEETGLSVRAIFPLVIERGHDQRHIVIRFLCECVEWPQTITLSDELLDYAWISLDDLPDVGERQVDAIMMAAAFYRGGLVGSEVFKPLGVKTEDS